MRKFAEVHQEVQTDLGLGLEQLAALDVTDDADGGRQTMDDLKVAYGVAKIYRWHFCKHDDRASCSIIREV